MTTDAVDLIKLSEELTKRLRGNACIILTRDHLRQKAWAAHLASCIGASHLNLLDEMVSPEARCKIAEFSVDGLFKYLENRSDTPVLVVSGIEFIKATWAYNPRKTMDQFVKKVELWSKKPALLFVIQYDSFLAQTQFTRFKDLHFVVDQQNTIAL